ncbi:hypothetical protein JYU34_022133 [Plutella xylostella]|uniref:Uncharacterized protein n=1 Tax=Plutella xylostella TaxID=51655 RepID=A0ABQ7PQK2_PLUXY|nr:hypothetical protein JYU34_022133 [Plutella xylostella]
MDIMGRGPEKRDFRDARDEFNKMDDRRPMENKRDFEPEPKRQEFKLGIRNDLFNPDLGAKKEEFVRKETFGGDGRGDGFGRRDEMQRDMGRDNDGGRRMSPGRRISPPRRMSPRRVSPRQPSPGRRMSPSRRPISPGRRISPDRRISPGRRLSPGRKVSPRRSPQRYSPSRLYEKPEFEPRPAVKQVRPAYEPGPAPSQYSGGYRGSITENVQYPVPKRTSPWVEGNGNSYKKPEDDRREFTRPFDRPGEKRSRSPVHRDRSPIGFRAKRHSPSPRSPRRSWAQEKRNSPDMLDAPPPPAWHGKSDTFNRPKVPERFEKEEKRPAVWERRPDKPDHHSSRFDDYRKDGPSRSDHRKEDTSDVWKSRDVPKYRPEDDLKRREELRSKDFDREPFRRRDDKEDRDSFFKRTVDRKDFDPKDRHDDRRPDDYRKEEFRKPDFKDARRQNSPPRFQDRRVPSLAKEQRDRAAEKIADRICSKHKVSDSRVYEELKVTLSMKVFSNFGSRTVATNDIVEWFIQRYNEAEQSEMLADVVESLPKGRSLKRPGEEMPENSQKINRPSPSNVTNAENRKDSPKLEKQIKEEKIKVKKEQQKISVKKEVQTPAKEGRSQKEKKRIEVKKTTEKDVKKEPSRAVRKSARLAPKKEKPREKEREYELSPCLRDALEGELQEVMKEALSVLPENARSEAERVAIEKLKTETFDTLKSVIAMNVSERILNVPRKLYAKITALSPMPPAWLTSFLSRYECRSCEFVHAGARKTFIVRLKSYSAFDKVCALDMRKSRGVSLSVVPMCNFIRKPEEVKVKVTKSKVKKETSTNDDGETKSKESTEAKTVDVKEENIKKEKVDEDDKESKMDKDDKMTIKKEDKNGTETKEAKNGIDTVENASLTDKLDMSDMSSLLNDGVVLDECLGSDDE